MKFKPGDHVIPKPESTFGDSWRGTARVITSIRSNGYGSVYHYRREDDERTGHMHDQTMERHFMLDPNWIEQLIIGEDNAKI